MFFTIYLLKCLLLSIQTNIVFFIEGEMQITDNLFETESSEDEEEIEINDNELSDDVENFETSAAKDAKNAKLDPNFIPLTTKQPSPVCNVSWERKVEIVQASRQNQN